MAVVQAHEVLVWNMHHEASEKMKLGGEDLRRILLEAWLHVVKQRTGKQIQVVVSKNQALTGLLRRFVFPAILP